MAIIHTIAFNFRDDASAQAKSQMVEALNELQRHIDFALSYHHGPNLGFDRSNTDYGICAVFANAEDFARYGADPLHQQVIANAIAPVISDRHSLQFEAAL